LDPNIHSITDIASVSHDPDIPRAVAPESPRAGTTLNVAGEYSKGVLFMKLCIVCALPTAPVLSGVWKTCGSMRMVTTSLLIRKVQRDSLCVDNNLFGVSSQVTVSGVLVFGQIFAALSPGNGGLQVGRAN
jgi:hypothetical protein